MANRTKLTRSKQKKFLKALAETANVSAACKAIDFSRSSIYDRKKADKEFSARWDEAVDIAIDKLELEVRRRALHGTRKGVYYKGQRVATEREYSDALAMFILKGHRPEKYRENVKAEVVNDVRLHVVYDDERADGASAPPAPKTT